MLQVQSAVDHPGRKEKAAITPSCLVTAAESATRKLLNAWLIIYYENSCLLSADQCFISVSLCSTKRWAPLLVHTEDAVIMARDILLLRKSTLFRRQAVHLQVLNFRQMSDDLAMDMTAAPTMTSAVLVVIFSSHTGNSTMQTAFSHRVSPTGRVWSSLPDLRHVVPHQLHLCRHRRRLEPVHGILDRFFGSSGTHDGPELVAIDPDSDGGLGGISDGLFGPLVCLL
jgi:hypothetical protein